MRKAGVVLFLFCSLLLNAQEEQKTSVKFGGYVRYEAFYDTYKSVDTRDGEVYLFPLAKSDVNEVGQFEMLALQTRLNAKIKGPDAFGAKTSGLVEVDFLGIAGGHERAIRLRHALMKLDWTNTQLMMGQFWHVMWDPKCFPATVSMGAGVPFHVLNRSPQLRLTQKLSPKMNLVLGLHMHGYHAAKGPSTSQRDAGLPDSQIKLEIGDPKQFYMAVTAGYKWLRPVLIDSVKNEAYDKRAGSYNLKLGLRYNTSMLDFRAAITQGENMSSYVMLGGYGIKTGSVNASDGSFDYANLVTRSYWAFVTTKGKTAFGAFIGYSENLGSNDEYTPLLVNGGKPSTSGTGLVRSSNIKNIFRFGPQVTITSGKVQFGAELMYTSANYAIDKDGDGNLDIDEKGKVKEYEKSDNVRFLFSAKYSF